MVEAVVVQELALEEEGKEVEENPASEKVETVRESLEPYPEKEREGEEEEVNFQVVAWDMQGRKQEESRT